MMKLKDCIAICVVWSVAVVLASGENLPSSERYNVFNIESDPTELIYRALQENLVSESGGTCDIFKNYIQNGGNAVHTYDAQESDALWILKMLDSWSKFPSGIFTGNIIDNGQFYECFDLEASVKGETVKGQYCGRAVNIAVMGIPVALSICIPDKCKLNTLVSTNLNISNVLCQTKGTNSTFEWDDWTVTGVFTCILVIIFLSTCYDSILYYTDSKPRGPLYIAFSLLTNGKKLFAVSSGSGQVGCLNGIRTISLMWIIAGHRYVSQMGVPQLNMFETVEWRASRDSSYISSARAAVDTFFFLSAFLLSYNYFKGVKAAIAKAEAKGSSHVQNPLTLAKLPMFYIHRILRITPALAALYFTQITILRRVSNGPISPYIFDLFRNTCTKWWWSLFLYVQNYVNYHEMCIVPTWYLAADMQMYLLSPLLIIPLGNLMIKGKAKLIHGIMIGVIIICIIFPMIIDFYREFIIDNIYETHTRLSVYTMGIYFGIIVIHYKDKKININYVVNVLLWALSLGLMLAIILTMHTTEAHPEKLKNNLFFTFTRPLWTLGLSWIIFACHFGYGGAVNWMLSKSIFQIMTRLSFSMYLLHNMLITISLASSTAAIHFSEYETMYTWCGDYIFTLVLSIFWVLCFESPVVVLEKVLFSTGKRPEKPAASNEQAQEQKTEGQQA